MLYLAEVKNQTRALLGSYKTEFKLLASQGNDQIWTPINSEEIIIHDGLNDQISKGSLYILNLSTNNQIQGPPELAGQRLVNYLKHFYRILEKSKTQEEEIEQWKVSLRIQSEEIANRQVELDGQQQQLQAKEEELAKLQEEKDKLQEAWTELHKLEQNSLAKAAKFNQIREAIAGFSNSINDPTSLREYYRQALDLLNNQQAVLDRYWQQLQQEKNQVEQQQQDFNQTRENLQKRREEVKSTLENLQKAQIDLEVQKNIIKHKEELLGQINLYLEEIENLRQDISDLNGDVSDGDSEHKIDFNALESMPLGDLENVVNNLKEETEKVVKFVNMQEEELTVQSDFVKELQQKIAQSSEIDKFSLETELADAQEAMALLDETLVGQRRNLKKQQKIFNQHLKILNRRKGILDLENFPQIDLDPLLQALKNKSNNTLQTKNKLDSEIQSLRESLGQVQEMVNQKSHNYYEQEQQLQQQEENWQESKLNIAQMQSKVQLLEEELHPLQETLNNLRQCLQNIEGSVNSLDQNSNQQREIVAEMESLIQG